MAHHFANQHWYGPVQVAQRALTKMTVQSSRRTKPDISKPLRRPAKAVNWSSAGDQQLAIGGRGRGNGRPCGTPGHSCTRLWRTVGGWLGLNRM